jgi:histidine ammonia-lyase
MTPPAPGAVELTTADLELDQLLRIAHGARVTLAPGAVARIRASRAVVDRLVDGPDLVYGLNTGLGHLRDTAVSRDQLRRYQELIVGIHEGGIGQPLPVPVVRAAMAVRLNGIVRGGSGASLEVAEGLAGLLNAGVHPVVPTIGSVGASDLMHMAAIAQVLLGDGRAELDGEVLPGGEALARVGLVPLVLQPKDGLTLISANGVSIGHAALVVEHATRLALAADLALAVSIEVLSGNPSVLDPAVLAAKAVAGQAEAGADIRAFLDGSELFTPGAPRSVQDPLSFRVGPQVHGAFRDVVGRLESAVVVELNAMDDNPLVDLATGRMLSNGNFHPMVLALALDALRPAIAHVGQLSDRRLNHLWAAAADLFLDEEVMVNAIESGMGLLRYAAAARASELRLAAQPVTLDVGALDLGVEDHATNAPLAARVTDEALRILEDVLAIELLTAETVVREHPPERRLAPAVQATLAALEDVRTGLGPGPSPADVHAATAAALYGGVLGAATREAGRSA